jgi:hypothetical protein
LPIIFQVNFLPSFFLSCFGKIRPLPLYFPENETNPIFGLNREKFLSDQVGREYTQFNIITVTAAGTCRKSSNYVYCKTQDHRDRRDGWRIFSLPTGCGLRHALHSLEYEFVLLKEPSHQIRLILNWY